MYLGVEICDAFYLRNGYDMHLFSLSLSHSHKQQYQPHTHSMDIEANQQKRKKFSNKDH